MIDFQTNRNSAQVTHPVNLGGSGKNFQSFSSFTGSHTKGTILQQIQSLLQLIQVIQVLIQQLQQNAPRWCPPCPSPSESNKNDLPISDAVKDYLKANFTLSGEPGISDQNGDGKISAGDRIAVLDDQMNERILVIDQALADKLNNLDNPPAQTNNLPISDAVKDYLKANFTLSGEPGISDQNGDGKISAGDRIAVLDDQMNERILVIDQALADKLNNLG